MSIPFTWVYLLYDPYTRLFKIGKADDPTARHKQLCSPSGTIAAAPTNYKLLNAWLCPEQTESELHRVYADFRIRGEWFDLIQCFQLKFHDFIGDEVAEKLAFSALPQYKSILNESSYYEDEYYFRIPQLEQQVRQLQGNAKQLEAARLMGYSPTLLMAAPIEIESGDIPF